MIEKMNSDNTSSLLKNKHGIYKILNLKNGKFYVGSAVDLYNRRLKHKSDLNKNIHNNDYLQRSWNKYGIENFEFIVLEYVENKFDLISREQYWIDALNCCDQKIGYNLAPTAGSMLGFKHTDETKRKSSESRKGIKTKPHTRRN